MSRKYSLFLTLWLLLLLQACSPGTQTTYPIFVEGQKHLVIIHPTVANLKTIQYLVQEGIFPMEEDLRIVGVYHQSAAYDYKLSKKFLKENNMGHVALLGLETPLRPDELFRENHLTDGFREIFQQAYGIIFMGGPDIPPSVYGKPTNLLTVITDPHRHYFELSFLFHLLGGSQNEAYVPFLEQRPHLPVLGICLGMQSMNVATGGTLIQDIPTEVYGKFTVEDLVTMDANRLHRNNFNHLRSDPDIVAYSFHEILIEPGSHMEQVAGSHTLTPGILSSHHQAVLDLGKDFRITAWCMDKKIVEAIEHTRFPHVIGVQFHPEVNALYQKDTKIGFVPGEPARESFLDLFPGNKGEDFHRSFWLHFASLHRQPA